MEDLGEGSGEAERSRLAPITEWNAPPLYQHDADPVRYAEHLISHISHHQFIFALPMTSFVERKVWNGVPAAWQHYVMNWSVDCLLKGEAMADWPEDAVLFLDRCKALSMPRTPHQYHPSSHSSHAPPPWQSAATMGAPTTINPEIQRGMSPKKLHEVSVLSPVLANLAAYRGFGRWIDIGAGLGYLGNVMQYHYGLRWTNCEGNASHAARGQARVSVLSERLKANQSSAALSFPCINVFLTHDSPADTFETSSIKDDPAGLCGLHACGDLSVCILKIFASPQCSSLGILSVGCCYHKLLDKDASKSFPLSQRVRNIIQAADTPIQPVVNMLELATNALGEWTLLDVRSLELRVNQLLFRSILDVLLLSYVPNGANLVFHVKKMKSQGVFEQPFVEYVDKALDRLWVRTKDNPAIPDESFRSVNVPAANLISEWTQVRNFILQDDRVVQFNQLYAHVRKQIAGFLSLQAALAPVAESLVLLDRYLFLKERGANAWLVPLFDPKDSPRNIALISLKT